MKTKDKVTWKHFRSITGVGIGILNILALKITWSFCKYIRKRTHKYNVHSYSFCWIIFCSNYSPKFCTYDAMCLGHLLKLHNVGQEMSGDRHWQISLDMSRFKSGMLLIQLKTFTEPLLSCLCAFCHHYV